MFKFWTKLCLRHDSRNFNKEGQYRRFLKQAENSSSMPLFVVRFQKSSYRRKTFISSTIFVSLRRFYKWVLSTRWHDLVALTSYSIKSHTPEEWVLIFCFLRYGFELTTNGFQDVCILWQWLACGCNFSLPSVTIR